mmetsp:Transcript_26413/g.62043  ORF Transcript_26413/g.62043 Transcript_26413/m.62043 type:complete len:546 (-) Transcript_26413:2458-4095(-)
MSQVYSTEPQSSGTVVLETTHGPLSIHLWCKECPYTVRFFLQLCVDGFYNNLVFHRIVPNFLIQTGDPHFRQNGNNDCEMKDNVINPWRQPLPQKYRQQHRALETLDRRKYELNSRIRFNHRGQIAMALGIDDNDDEDNTSKSFARLQPQFFITLEEATYLDGKHVCFGGISGPTIFNAMRIGQTDVFNSNEENDMKNFQPRILSEAPRILRTKILEVNLPPTLPALAPTQDRSLLPWNTDFSSSVLSKAENSRKRKKKSRKGIKNINLLSFGEEMIDERASDNDKPKETAKRIQSTHDVLPSKLLSMDSIKVDRSKGMDGNHVPDQANFIVKNKTSKTDHNGSERSREDDVKKNIWFGSSTRSSHGNSFPSSVTTTSSELAGQTIESTPTTTNTKNPLHFNGANNVIGDTEKKKKQKKISLVEARRAMYAQKGRNRIGGTKQQREDETMAKFKEFQQKMVFTTVGKAFGNEEKTSATYHGQILERDTDSSDWINTKFKCKRHIDHDDKSRGSDGRGVDDYNVFEERNSATDRKPGKRKRFRPET